MRVEVSEKSLVTDGLTRNAVAAVRSLGKIGVSAHIGEMFRWSPAGCSKYCTGQVIYPNPQMSDGILFQRFIKKTLDVGEYDSLIPISDTVLLKIVGIRKDVEARTGILLPRTGLLLDAMDKLGAMALAEKHGVRVPSTLAIEKADDALDAFRTMGGPLFFKPRLGSGSRGAFLANESTEALRLLPCLMPQFGRYVAQENIPEGGDQIGVYMLFNRESKIRGLTVQRRIRSYPVGGGPSTLRETIKRPDLTDTVTSAFEHMGWVGPCMAEFRTDPRDNVAYLIEINARFWGSLQLSILSGIDFPSMLHRIIVDGDVKSNLQYHPGVRCRWLLPGDILWLMHKSNRLRGLRAFMKFRGQNFDVASLSDFGPVIGTVVSAARYLPDEERRKYVIR